MADAFDEAKLAVPSYGDVVVCLPRESDPIADELRAGNYELPPSMRLVLDLVGRGTRLLDLGAHLGTVALAAAAKGADVLAVEASPRNTACLVASKQRNDLSKLTVCNVAVGDGHSSIRFREEGPYGRVSTSGEDTDIEIDMRPATELVAKHGWDGVDVVKIDVEGYELRVVDGLRPLLAAPAFPPVVFEANRHVLAPHGNEPGDVVAAFIGLGYQTYLVADGTLVPADAHTFQPETVADYLAIAPGTEAPWPVRERPGNDEIAARVAREAASSLPEARAALARGLAFAPRALLGKREVERALEALVIDPDDTVAAAASWWPAWRHARAARTGLLAAVADGWRAVADSTAALAPTS
jgi:FkbM family methyltransferase